MITNDEGIELKVANRLRKATSCYYTLNRIIFGKNEVDLEIKVMVYNAIALSTVLYASEI